jgi:hypothetical protein
MEEGELEQLLTRIFVLKNEFLKKEQEIMNYEAYYKSLRKNKGIVLEHVSKDEMIMSKVFNSVVSELRERYCNISKQTITHKNLYKKHNKKLNQVKTEIDIIKNPNKKNENPDTDDRDAAHGGANTKTSTPIIKQNKIENSDKDKLEIVKLDSAIDKNKTIIEDLDTDIDTYKKITFQLESENADLNKELTDKLSMIYILEMKLAKLKNYK